VKLEGQDLVCVGFADWDAELPTNQHHLMGRLAQRNRVLFVESLGLRRPQLAGRDARRILRRLRRGLAKPRERGGVHVLSPLVIPLHGQAALRRLNAWLLRLQVRRASRRLGMQRPILWGYVPQAEQLIPALEPQLVVYHCVDDIAAQKGVDAEAFRAAEERFARAADLVIASARSLAERLGRIAAAPVLYAPNVADTPLFSTALEPGPEDAGIEPLARPRIVFHGALVATKLDLGLIAGLARLRPDWSIALIGPRGLGDPGTDLSAIEGIANVHELGPRAHDELPAVLRGAAAGIIPYAINPLTSSVFPMKVYEYLAAGLPVVTTPLPALEDVEDVVIAGDAEAMAAALDRELAADTPALRAERSRRAASHSWDARIAEIEAALP
jgi:glycosyltransferase involved in cell wall biosynthesis